MYENDDDEDALLIAYTQHALTGVNPEIKKEVRRKKKKPKQKKEKSGSDNSK